MLSARLSTRLAGLADASAKGYPIRNLYHLMYEKELWMLAYANIHSNAGAVTTGVDATTLDGFSTARVDRLVRQLRQGVYRPRPVRRTYVPKKNGKVRALGIPNGDDKLLQEVMRILLERIYEPLFSEASHGFRKGRSCHTALRQVGSSWNGTKWTVNLDLRGCFDALAHDKLLELLSSNRSEG